MTRNSNATTLNCITTWQISGSGSSGMLHGVRWYLVTDVFLNHLKDGADRLSWNVSNQLPTYATQHHRRPKACITTVYILMQIFI